MVELVKDFMISKKEVVAPDDSVASAIDLMVENDIGSVIVVGNDQKVIGIFTERDLLRNARTHQSKFFSLNMSEVMSKPVHTVTADTPLSTAIKIMKEKGIGRVPVVNDEGHLVGILFWRDILYGLAFGKI